MPALELKGLRVGKLKVLHKSKNKQGKGYWICKCDCGSLTEVRASNLNQKGTKSCGCLVGDNHFVLNLIGLKSGRLTVIEKSHKSKDKNTIWKCLCNCGNYTYVRASALKRGAIKSCGCSRGKKIGISLRKTYGEASRNILITNYKIGAMRRNLDFSLSIEECESIFKRNCHYCDKEPSQVLKTKNSFGEYIYNGIDRVINEKGYFINNAVPCCIQCNERKRAFTYDEFLKHIGRIYSNLSKIKQIVYPLSSIDKIMIDKSCDFEKINFLKTNPAMKAPGVSNRNTLLRQYKNGAKSRKLSINFTKEEVTFLFKSNCYYCQRPPHQVKNKKRSNGSFIYTGIDRVDNNKGYEKDNVVPCCKRCNYWKKALTYDQFKGWVIKVHENINSKQLAQGAGRAKRLVTPSLAIGGKGLSAGVVFLLCRGRQGLL